MTGRLKLKTLTLILLTCIACGNQRRDDPVKLGNAEIPVPAGWRPIIENRERINIVSRDERQQATISVMTFGSNPTFEDFKRVCGHRLKAEMVEAPDASISADEPFVEGETFGMYFHGHEKIVGRLFSGFLTQRNKELITVYLESVGVDSEKHFSTFEEIVKGLKWH